MTTVGDSRRVDRCARPPRWASRSGLPRIPGARSGPTPFCSLGPTPAIPGEEKDEFPGCVPFGTIGGANEGSKTDQTTPSGATARLAGDRVRGDGQRAARLRMPRGLGVGEPERADAAMRTIPARSGEWRKPSGIGQPTARTRTRPYIHPRCPGTEAHGLVFIIGPTSRDVLRFSAWGGRSPVRPGSPTRALVGVP